ncbi:Flagellar basal body rod protein FlgB [Rubripirellula amarantea]|uniref:Flagellar basal body rod protein FlgB n=1 Tax=Rubripirellula amarantea TaxID=2527999 RepID=A0A5C5WS61_9BACT|nr:flagellar basal body rod protein FlgB [Rubripirellula amarantea]TWT52999.1 Flagellar basal body rod protein FlgB [Rubripirellula amarantea]
MINLFQTTAIPALEQTAMFAQRRHELLAGNLANVDTPGYRSRDLDVGEFHSALSDSIEASTRPQSVSPSTREDMIRGPRDAMEQVVFHDGSDVSLEHQVTEIAKNQHMHSLAITAMRSQFSLLQAAITERA